MFRWSAARDRGQNRDRIISITCSSDGRAHDIDEHVLVSARSAGTLLQALCGHPVLAASLAAPPGADCGLCAATRTLAG